MPSPSSDRGSSTSDGANVCTRLGVIMLDGGRDDNFLALRTGVLVDNRLVRLGVAIVR